MPLGSAAFEGWYQWRRSGTLPRPGGWAGQPLSLTTQMRAIDVTHRVYTQKVDEKGNVKLSDLEPFEKRLHLWLEGDA